MLQFSPKCCNFRQNCIIWKLHHFGFAPNCWKVNHCIISLLQVTENCIIWKLHHYRFVKIASFENCIILGLLQIAENWIIWKLHHFGFAPNCWKLHHLKIASFRVREKWIIASFRCSKLVTNLKIASFWKLHHFGDLQIGVLFATLIERFTYSVPFRISAQGGLVKVHPG